MLQGLSLLSLSKLSANDVKPLVLLVATAAAIALFVVVITATAAVQAGGVEFVAFSTLVMACLIRINSACGNPCPHWLAGSDNASSSERLLTQVSIPEAVPKSEATVVLSLTPGKHEPPVMNCG